MPTANGTPDIIVAESDFLTGEVLLSSLDSIGRRAVLARDGDVLLSLIDKYAPQVVILDLNLSRPGALQMLRSLQQKQTRIVAALRIGQAKLRGAARAFGVTSFLEMPFSIDELRDTIEGAAQPR